jgi:hypothetical protein
VTSRWIGLSVGLDIFYPPWTIASVRTLLTTGESNWALCTSFKVLKYSFVHIRTSTVLLALCRGWPERRKLGAVDRSPWFIAQRYFCSRRCQWERCSEHVGEQTDGTGEVLRHLLARHGALALRFLSRVQTRFCAHPWLWAGGDLCPVRSSGLLVEVFGGERTSVAQRERRQLAGGAFGRMVVRPRQMKGGGEDRRVAFEGDEAMGGRVGARSLLCPS